MKTLSTTKDPFRFLRLFPVLLAALFLVCLFPACQTSAKAFYGSLGQGSSPVPFMAKARTGVLPSGLRYYILENTMPQGRAFLTLAVNAGSVLETEEERGLAHFVEHMAFNGTERFPEAELINYLRSLGMRFGPEVNAYTSYDETVYGIEVPVEIVDGRRRIPDTALAVIDDWTRAITFTPADVDDERLVILEEYRARLGASDRMRREMLPVIFRGSPYANRLPIGLPEIIENAPAERLAEFYKKWYRPDNMALIFVGDFDAELLESSLVSHFHITAATTPLNRPHYTLPEPKKGSIQTLVLTDPEYTQSRIDIYFKRKAELPRSDLAGYRNDVIDYLVDTIISYRFNDATSKPQTPYMAAAAGTVRYGYGSRYYILVGIAKTGLSAQVIEELLTIKESLSRYGFLEDEFDMAKRALISDMEQLAAEKDRQNSNYYVSAFTRHFLQGETLPDIEWELEAIRIMLPSISLKEINQSVKNYFADDDITVFVNAPDSERQSLPTESAIRLMAANVKRARIDPPVSTIIKGELLDQTPYPGSILGEMVDPETGAVYWYLSNGMGVLLKETANRNNEISLYGLARGGTMSVPDAQDISASLAAEMLAASGLGPYSRPELTRALADKQVSFSFWADAFLRGFQGSAARGDLKVLMEMIHLGFTQPRLDPEAVSILLEQYRT
jgi:zinc protease